MFGYPVFLREPIVHRDICNWGVTGIIDIKFIYSVINAMECFKRGGITIDRYCMIITVPLLCRKSFTNSPKYAPYSAGMRCVL